MRLEEIALSAVSLEEMRRFYCGVLGLREVEPYWTGRLVVQAGATRLIFLPAPEGWRGRYHFAFDVPPGRFEAALRWLKERGGTLASPDGETRFHSDNWNADSVYFADIQGNILELICRLKRPGEEEAAVPGAAAPAAASAVVDAAVPADRPFNAAEILAVTEIGLATNTVVDTVGVLLERIPGLKVYSGEGSDTLTAVGDRQGLLIVVRRDRIWFPETGVPAEFLPLDLLISIGSGQRYRLTAPPFPFSASPM